MSQNPVQPNAAHMPVIPPQPQPQPNNMQRRQSMPTQNMNPQQPPASQSQKYSQTRSKSVIEQSTFLNKKGQPCVDYLIGGTKFIVRKKYKVLRAIGHGAYGFVCSAQNTETNEFVAIKKITNLFNNPIETKRAIREVQLLRKLRHENILGLIDLSMNDARTDLYLVAELMDSDLHQIIVSKQQLSNDHIQYFIYQILRGLLFIHSANVIHRDLKPSNILVNSNCDIKICDFGLARPVAVDAQVQDHKAFMTEYVATRWYRAPEIMLSWRQYSAKIDIWATGCILAELLGRMPLFPGKDYMDQLKRTLNYIGKPNGDEISHIRTERARQWVRNFPPTPRVDWAHLYPNAHKNSIDLLDQMLQFSPSKRITVQDALKHKYLEQLHDAEDEPVANFKFDMKFEQEFKDNTVEISKTKQVLERELHWFQEFQNQRTKYLLRVKGSKTTNSNTQSPQSSVASNNDQKQRTNHQFQSHVVQQQMMQHHQQQQQQQQQYARTRSQSYPMLPHYQQQMVNQQQQHTHHPQYVQHQQYLQQQQFVQQQQYQRQLQQMQHAQSLQSMQTMQNMQTMQQHNHNVNNVMYNQANHGQIINRPQQQTQQQGFQNMNVD
eukprot:226172_1